MKVYVPFSLVALALFILPSTAAMAGKADKILQVPSVNYAQLATQVNYYDVHRKKRGHHPRYHFKRKHDHWRHKRHHRSRGPHPWYGSDYRDYRDYRGYRGYRGYRHPRFGRHYRHHRDYRRPRFLRYYWD